MEIKNTEELTERVIKPIMDIIDENFFICIETCDNNGNEKKIPLNKIEENIKILEDVKERIENQVSKYENGSIIFDACSGKLGFGEQKAQEHRCMLTYIEYFLKFIDARANQIKKAVDLGAKKRKQQAFINKNK